MLSPRFIHFEAVEGAAPEGGGGPEPEVADEWSGVPREDWENVTGYLQETAPILQQLQQALAQAPAEQGGGEAVPDLDLFDEDSVKNFIAHATKASINEAFQDQFGDFTGLLGMLASDKGEELARQEMESIKGEVGDFNEDLSLLISRGLLSEDEMEPGQALRTSAQFAANFEKEVRENERQKVLQEYQLIAEGDSSLPAGGGEHGQVPPPSQDEMRGPDRYQSAVQRVLARRRGMPAGAG